MNITRFYDNFIANVTHELKSPLSSIQLYLETMKQRKITADRQNEFINLMLKDTERLNDLITSILDISGLEQKKLAYNFRIYEADDTIRGIIENAISEYQLPASAVRIEGSLAGQIVVDKRAIRIVINNIIDNAIKYSKQDVELLIELETSSQNMILRFTDQGIGISTKDQNIVFKKFQRIYNISSPNVKGTGLGLYWVREILKAHGGKISLSSPGRGAGSTFLIELPAYNSKKRYINRLLKLTRRKDKYMEAENE
jgi:signal transduction histidine kinase